MCSSDLVCSSDLHLNRLNELNKTEVDSLEALAISVQSCIHLLALGGYCLPLQTCCHSGSRLIPPIGEWSWKCSFIPEEGFAIGAMPNSIIELNPSELALLQRLLQEISPPLLASENTMFGTGQLPKFENDQFEIKLEKGTDKIGRAHV